MKACQIFLVAYVWFFLYWTGSLVHQEWSKKSGNGARRELYGNIKRTLLWTNFENWKLTLSFTATTSWDGNCLCNLAYEIEKSHQSKSKNLGNESWTETIVTMNTCFHQQLLTPFWSFTQVAFICNVAFHYRCRTSCFDPCFISEYARKGYANVTPVLMETPTMKARQMTLPFWMYGSIDPWWCSHKAAPQTRHTCFVAQMVLFFSLQRISTSGRCNVFGKPPLREDIPTQITVSFFTVVRGAGSTKKNRTERSTVGGGSLIIRPVLMFHILASKAIWLPPTFLKHNGLVAFRTSKNTTKKERSWTSWRFENKRQTARKFGYFCSFQKVVVVFCRKELKHCLQSERTTSP